MKLVKQSGEFEDGTNIKKYNIPALSCVLFYGSSNLELRPMMVAMMEYAKKLLHSDICNVFLVDEKNQEVKIR